MADRPDDAHAELTPRTYINANVADDLANRGELRNRRRATLRTSRTVSMPTESGVGAITNKGIAK
jgi:hypothetical protein